MSPGIDAEQVAHLVRGEWAEICVPHASQNDIECVGHRRINEKPDDFEPTPAGGKAPIIVWK